MAAAGLWAGIVHLSGDARDNDDVKALAKQLEDAKSRVRELETSAPTPSTAGAGAGAGAGAAAGADAFAKPTAGRSGDALTPSVDGVDVLEDDDGDWLFDGTGLSEPDLTRVLGREFTVHKVDVVRAPAPPLFSPFLPQRRVVSIYMSVCLSVYISGRPRVHPSRPGRSHRKPRSICRRRSKRCTASTWAPCGKASGR